MRGTVERLQLLDCASIYLFLIMLVFRSDAVTGEASPAGTVAFVQ
jgi:hypothetical protein